MILYCSKISNFRAKLYSRQWQISIRIIYQIRRAFWRIMCNCYHYDVTLSDVCYRCANRNAKMVCSECPMVPVGVVRDRAVPAGRPAHLQRPQRRTAAGFGRSGRRRGHIRFRPDDSGRPGVPETQVSEDQQTIASGGCKKIKLKYYHIYDALRERP